MVQKIQAEKTPFAQNINKNIDPETKIEIPIPESIKNQQGLAVEFTVKTVPVEDITIAWNNRPTGPVLPFPGNIEFKDVTINNEESDTTLPPEPPKELRFPVTDSSALYIKKSDGTILPLESIPQDNESKLYTINLSDYEDSKVSVNLNQDYLIEDNLVDATLYEVIMVTFEYNQVSNEVGFIIDEESVSVVGYQDNGDNPVSNIVFNEIEI